MSHPLPSEPGCNAEPKPKPKNGPHPATWKAIIVQDMIGVLILAALTAGSGFGLNRWRATPLPLVSLSKAERIQKAVANVGRNRVLASESGMESESGLATPSAESRFLEFSELREIVDGKIKAVLLDARPEVFHRFGHIPGAHSLSREAFERDYAKVRPLLEADKSQMIAIYCADSDCEDSQMVADALVRLAYTRVFVFKGGWSDWTGAHLPEEKAR